MEAYRRRRVEQLRLTALRNRFGRVYPLRRDEFSREVTDASREGMPDKDKAKGKGGRDDDDDEAAEGYAAAGSRAASSVSGGADGSAGAGSGEGEGGVYVVVLLYKAGIPDSRLMEDLFTRVAEKHKVRPLLADVICGADVTCDAVRRAHNGRCIFTSGVSSACVLRCSAPLRSAGHKVHENRRRSVH